MFTFGQSDPELAHLHISYRSDQEMARPACVSILGRTEKTAVITVTSPHWLTGGSLPLGVFCPREASLQERGARTPSFPSRRPGWSRALIHTFKNTPLKSKFSPPFFGNVGFGRAARVRAYLLVHVLFKVLLLKKTNHKSALRPVRVP